MKKKLYLLIISFGISLSMFSSYKPIKADSNSIIENENFKRKLLMVLNKPLVADVTLDELKTIKRLEITSQDYIRYDDLTFKGIELLENLEFLSIQNIYATSLDNIKNLSHLKELHLQGTALVNLNEIQSITQLEKFSAIRNSLLSDLSGLNYLTNMTSLILRENYQTNIYPNFSQFSHLKELGIDVKEVLTSHLELLENCEQIESLSLNFIDDTDLNFLHLLPNLKDIKISGQYSGDLTGFSHLTLLEKIVTNGTHKRQVINLEHIKDAKNLKHLEIQFNQLMNESAIANLDKLEYLDMYNSVYNDKSLKFLYGLSNLVYLDITGAEITSIENLKDLRNLKFLYANSNKISDLVPLALLVDLIELDFDYNEIADLKPISKLTQLKSLRISDNLLTSLEGIDGLINLEYFNFSFNKVESIDILRANQNLRDIEMTSNKIRDISVLQYLQNLHNAYAFAQEIDLEIVWGDELIQNFIDYGNYKDLSVKKFIKDGKYSIDYLMGALMHSEDLEIIDLNLSMNRINQIVDREDSEPVTFDNFKINQEDIDYIKNNFELNKVYSVSATIDIEGQEYELEFITAFYDFTNEMENIYYHLLRRVRYAGIYEYENEIYDYDEYSRTFKGLNIGEKEYYFYGLDHIFSGQGNIKVIPAKLEVQYLDQQGEIIEDSIIYEGKHNDEQVLETKVIDGYELVNGPEDNKALFDGKHKVVTYVYEKLPVFQLSLNDMRMLKSKYDALKASSKLDAFLKDHLVYELKDEALNIAELSEVEVLIEEENVDGENKHLVKLSGKYDGKTYEATAYIYLDESYRLIVTTHNMLKSTYNELLSSNQIKDYLISEMGVKLVNEYDVVIDIDDVEVDLSGVKENVFGNYEVTFKTTHQNSPYQITSELNLTSNYRIEARDHTMLLSKYEAFKKLGVLNDYLINQMQLQLLDDDDQKVSVDHIQIVLAEIENEGRYNLHAQIKHLEQSYFADVILTITKDASDVEEEVDPSYQLSAKDIQIEYKVLEKAMNEDRLKTLILEKSEAKLNLISRSSQVDIQVDTSLIKLEEGTYEVYLVGLYQGQVYDKHIKVTVYKETEEAKKPEGELPKTGVESQLPLGLGILMLGVLLIKKRSR